MGTGDLVDIATRQVLDHLATAIDDVVDYKPGERGGSDAWGRLIELRRLGDRIQAEIVELAGYVHDEGVVESREDLPCEIGLGIHAGLPVGDRRTLLTVADVLRTMPWTRAAFRRGEVSWGQVRAITLAASGLTVDERRDLDEGVERWHDEDRRSTDAAVLVDEVSDQVARLRPDRLERERARQYDGQFLSVQTALDGTSRWYGEFDATSTALMLEAVETAASRSRRDAGELEAEEHESQPTWKRRGRERAEALARVCDTYLAGGQDGPARPSMLVVTDAETIAGRSDEPDSLLWRLPHGPVLLSAEQIRRLHCEADTTYVLRDGTTIVGVATASPTTPESIRQMVIARDRYCRGPGCRRPIEVVHHVEYPDGPTDLRRQVGLCRSCHHRVHHRGWTLDMAEDGTCVWRRGRRAYTTHPHDRRRLRSTAWGGSRSADPPDDPPF